MNPFSVVAFAVRRWWDEWLPALGLSVLWLVAVLMVVGGPPATALLFAMAQRSYEGAYWGPADMWAAFKRLFWPGWKWGLLNGLVLAVGAYNLYAYWDAPGLGWTALRILWFAVLAVWLGLNLFYWPFWLAQELPTMRATYANCGRFWLLHAPAAAVVALVCLAVAASGVAFMVTILLGSAYLVALIGETAVRRSLEMVRARDAAG